MRCRDTLTDAERATRTDSNRFAAHILKQHQFNSLCAFYELFMNCESARKALKEQPQGTRMVK